MENVLSLMQALVWLPCLVMRPEASQARDALLQIAEWPGGT